MDLADAAALINSHPLYQVGCKGAFYEQSLLKAEESEDDWAKQNIPLLQHELSIAVLESAAHEEKLSAKLEIFLPPECLHAMHHHHRRHDGDGRDFYDPL